MKREIEVETERGKKSSSDMRLVSWYLGQRSVLDYRLPVLIAVECDVSARCISLEKLSAGE